MHTLIDLDGVTSARLRVIEDTPTLTLSAPSGFVEGHYYPAESITIQGWDALLELRMLLVSVEDRLIQPPEA